MQAVIINQSGGVEVMKLVQDHPMPTRKPGQVLVRIHSSSVNPVDTAIRSGALPIKFPKVLGGDLAGVVDEADEGSKFKKGDKVAALTPGFYNQTQDGTYCQYAVADESWLSKVPEGVDIKTAGGVPLVALTAWQALMEAQPHQGQRLLVLAASGGVGHMAVQLGKALGLYVVGVAGPANVEWVKQQLGADEVVDYKQEDFSEKYAADNLKFDVVVDCLPGNIAKCARVLKPSGHLSHIMNHGTDQNALNKLKEGGAGPSASLTLVKPNGAQLQELFELIAAGKVKLEVAQVFPLSEAAAAHQQVETGHTRGKVVLQIP